MLAQDQDGGLTVDSTLPGSPARRAGLEKGDRILRINGTPPGDLPPGAMGEIFGKPDEINLLVRRGPRQLELRLKPEKAD